MTNPETFDATAKADATATQPPLRRDFLKGAVAIAAMAVTGGAVIHTAEAWGFQPKTLSATTVRSLIKIARDIYPHDRIADQFYALAIKTYDEKSGADAKLKSLIERGVGDLDKLARQKHGATYAAVGWEKDRVNLLRAVQGGPFFKKLRGDLVVSLYNQKEVWPLFGYEGESASKGGYIARGFDDIKWI
ncbi:MAG: twin-arginine translocation signal domain-containing protein [Bosea sp. (in: a-proteobacteria)]